MPNIAPTISRSRMMTDRIGALTAISPMRSSPKAMLAVGGSSIARRGLRFRGSCRA
jgi:hypothetical protein